MKTQELPEAVRPFAALGLRLRAAGTDEMLADCPFCGRNGKLSVNTETGQWRCLVPHGDGTDKGNVYTFLRLLWEQGLANTGAAQWEELRHSRGLLSADTLEEWGVARNPLQDEWLLPAYGVDEELNALYRYVQVGDRHKLYALPGLGHQLYGVLHYDPAKPVTYLCEGPWDAMALWEMLRQTKKDVQGYTLTGAVPSSLYSRANVLATPSCGTFKMTWPPLFSGKKVVLCYDSDHPHLNEGTGRQGAPAGLQGAKLAAGALAASVEHRPESIHWIEWGPEGYDPELPSGTDVRDVLREAPAPRDRVKRLWWLMEKIRPIPADWLGGRTEEAKAEGGVTLSLLPCHTYREVKAAMQECFDFHEGMDRALSVMLATVLSTKAGGDQLWTMVVGPPACGKSSLCEAISTATRWVTAKSTIRGFHSGYKSDASGKEDNSLIPLIADKTLVTKDGDTLLQSPNLAQILSEARDLYDRTSRTHYRHGLSRNYQGVNMTWILCGTGALAEMDRSELGQRFIKVIMMEHIDDDQEWRILLRKARQADRAMDHETDGRPESQQDPNLTRAYQLTGGYVEYLRGNAAEMLKSIELDDATYAQCATLARFVSYLRARPSKVQKESAEREFATRLTSQFVRLTKCLCVVLNEQAPTPDVLRRVRQTALDTGRGRVQRLVSLLYEADVKGVDPRAAAYTLGEVEADVTELLVFLKKIRAVELYRPRVAPNVLGEPRWRLTPGLRLVYGQVMYPDLEAPRAAAHEQPEE